MKRSIYLTALGLLTLLLSACYSWPWGADVLHYYTVVEKGVATIVSLDGMAPEQRIDFQWRADNTPDSSLVQAVKLDEITGLPIELRIRTGQQLRLQANRRLVREGGGEAREESVRWVYISILE